MQYPVDPALGEYNINPDLLLQPVLTPTLRYSPTTHLRQLPPLPPHFGHQLNLSGGIPGITGPPVTTIGSTSNSNNVPLDPKRSPSATRAPSTSRSQTRRTSTSVPRSGSRQRNNSASRNPSNSRGRTARRDSDVGAGAPGDFATDDSNSPPDGNDTDELEAMDVIQEAKPTKRVKVGARASIACATCRKRKVRCSGEWPTCTFCSGRDMVCTYEGHPAEFGGPTSGYGLVKPFEIVLPSVEIMLEALQVFLLHNYDTFYFINKTIVAESIRNGTISRELAGCMLAFAARSCQSLIDLHPDTNVPEYYAALVNQSFLQRAPAPTPALNSAFSTPAAPAANQEISLTKCQCYLMLGLFECEGFDVENGWMKIGTAIRMSQILGLGHEDEDESNAKDPVLSEARRRTFWSCFLLERLIGDGRDRPITMRLGNNSVITLPRFDFEFTHPTSIGAPFDACPPVWAAPVQYPPHHHLHRPAAEEADLYGYTLRISELWQKINTYIGSGGRNIDRRVPWMGDSSFAVLANELLSFSAALPLRLSYSDSNLVDHSRRGQGRLFGLLHILYYVATLVLHRDFLPFLPSVHFDASKGPIDGQPLLFGQLDEPLGFWVNCLARALDAASVISGLCARLHQLDCQIENPFAGFAVLASSTLHLHVKYWPRSSQIPLDDHYINQDFQILSHLKEIYPLAETWCDGFTRLQALYSGLSRGILDVDPRIARSRVIKLLRTTTEDDQPLVVPGGPGVPYHSPVDLLALNSAGSSGSGSNSYYEADAYAVIPEDTTGSLGLGFGELDLDSVTDYNSHEMDTFTSWTSFDSYNLGHSI